MWYVYVLVCQGGSLYTGISPDPQRRFQEHLKGSGGAYTRSHKPRKIVYRERCGSKSAALKREYEIKSWNKARKLRMLNLQDKRY